MAVLYLWPAVVLWLIYGACKLFWALPWFVDYPLFGAACIATALGFIIGVIASAGRW